MTQALRQSPPQQHVHGRRAEAHAVVAVWKHEAQLDARTLLHEVDQQGRHIGFGRERGRAVGIDQIQDSFCNGGGHDDTV